MKILSYNFTYFSSTFFHINNYGIPFGIEQMKTDDKEIQLSAAIGPSFSAISRNIQYIYFFSYLGIMISLLIMINYNELRS